MGLNFNRVVLGGHLCRDPEQRFTGAGLAIASFTVAINEKRKEKETCTFADCTAFGKTAEMICQYFRKGNPILLEGRLRTESWEAKEGQKKSKLAVVVDSFTFVGGKKDDGGPAREPSASQAIASNEAPVGDDVPFSWIPPLLPWLAAASTMFC